MPRARLPEPVKHWWVGPHAFDTETMRWMVRRYLRRIEIFKARYYAGDGETKPPGEFQRAWLNHFAAGRTTSDIAKMEGAGGDYERVVETIRTAVRRMLVSDGVVG